MLPILAENCRCCTLVNVYVFNTLLPNAGLSPVQLSGLGKTNANISTRMTKMTESTAGIADSLSRLTWKLIHRQSSHSRLHPFCCLHSLRAIQRLHRKCRATIPVEIWSQRRFPNQFPPLPDQHESYVSQSVSVTEHVYRRQRSTSFQSY